MSYRFFQFLNRLRLFFNFASKQESISWLILDKVNITNSTSLFMWVDPAKNVSLGYTIFVCRSSDRAFDPDRSRAARRPERLKCHCLTRSDLLKGTGWLRDWFFAISIQITSNNSFSVFYAPGFFFYFWSIALKEIYSQNLVENAESRFVIVNL